MRTRRWNPACTPPRWTGAALLVAVWVVSEIAASVAHDALYQAENLRQADADSSAIFISGRLQACIAIAAFSSLVTWFVLRHYPGSVTLWHWQKTRPFWSGFWTLAAVWLIYQVLAIDQAATVKSAVDQVLSGFLIYLILMFRAILVARPPRTPS